MLLLLETERLILRPLTDDDAPFIVELLNQPSFVENIGDKGVRSQEDALRYLHEGPAASWARHGHGLYAVELAETGDTIGMCGLLKRDHLDHPDLGYAYLTRFWRNGYALEAARAVIAAAPHPGTLLAMVTPSNHGSIRVLEKLGFERAPDHPNHADALMYSRQLS